MESYAASKSLSGSKIPQEYYACKYANLKYNIILAKAINVGSLEFHHIILERNLIVSSILFIYNL